MEEEAPNSEWVHKESDIMRRTLFSGSKEHGKTRNRGVIVWMNDFEREYWMGTEGGQLEGYGFQGAMFGVDGSCKKIERWGQGAVNSEERGRQMCSSRRRRERHEFDQAGVGGICVSVTISSS
jgi:hypothetical protein